MFVFKKEEDNIEFITKTCYSVYKYVDDRRFQFLTSYYNEKKDYILRIKPHFMTLEQFNNLSDPLKSF